MSKEAFEMMKKAMAMMEQSYSMPTQEIESRMTPMPKEDGSSSSPGNSGTGGEVNDFDERKQKRAMVMASMKKFKY